MIDRNVVVRFLRYVIALATAVFSVVETLQFASALRLVPNTKMRVRVPPESLPTKDRNLGTSDALWLPVP